MKKRILWAVCILMLLAACFSAQAEEMTSAVGENWMASVDGSVITVTYTDGREAVALHYEKDEFTNELLIAQDYNFDGRTDLAALTLMGTVNSYYAVWLDTQEGFVLCDELSEVCAPFPDPMTGRIESYERISAGEYVQKSYVWEENIPKLFAACEVAYQPDGTIWITERTVKADGEDVRYRVMDEAEWYGAESAIAMCRLTAFELANGADARRMCIYEGMCVLDGENYYVCTVRKNYEVPYVIYISEDYQTVLVDDEADGEVQPHSHGAPIGENISDTE